MLTLAVTLTSAPTLAAAAYSAAAPAPNVRHTASPARAAVLSMGLFDGVKDAFGGDKPVVAADRVTPFDRWMGLDKALIEAENQVDESATYIDPNDTTNCACTLTELDGPRRLVLHAARR